MSATGVPSTPRPTARGSGEACRARRNASGALVVAGAERSRCLCEHTLSRNAATRTRTKTRRTRAPHLSRAAPSRAAALAAATTASPRALGRCGRRAAGERTPDVQAHSPLVRRLPHRLAAARCPLSPGPSSSTFRVQPLRAGRAAPPAPVSLPRGGSVWPALPAPPAHP